MAAVGVSPPLQLFDAVTDFSFQHPHHILDYYYGNGSTSVVDELIDGFSVIGSAALISFVLVYLCTVLAVFMKWADAMNIGSSSPVVPSVNTSTRGLKGNHNNRAQQQQQISSTKAKAPGSPLTRSPAAPLEKTNLASVEGTDFVHTAKREPLSGRTALQQQQEELNQDSSSMSSPLPSVPLPFSVHGIKHIAVIMDGNRRYGKQQRAETPDSSASSTRDSGSSSGSSSTLLQSAKALLSTSPAALYGHKQGGDKLIEFIEWCIESEVKILTVYAFSTENWSRPKSEVDYLMLLFESYFNKILSVSEEKGIVVRFVSTEPERLPPRILSLMLKVERQTAKYIQEGKAKIVVNTCVSYGSCSEMVRVCNRLAAVEHNRCQQQPQNDQQSQPTPPLNVAPPPPPPIREEDIVDLLLESVSERYDDADQEIPFSVVVEEGKGEDVHRQQRRHPARNEAYWTPKPDILFRTSGEQRLSNFLLYQCAYAELFFVQKTWPETTRDDLLSVVAEYCRRTRRFGK